jgi:hypothetical protein
LQEIAVRLRIVAEAVRVTYRREGMSWQAWLSTGERLPGASDLADARAAVLAHLGERVEPIAEFVQVPEIEGVEWNGLRFCQLAPTFDLDAPTAEQARKLSDCYEYYRQRLPEGMKLELYGNRVRIEPGAFGMRGQLIDALAGGLAAETPDDLDLEVGPSARSLDRALEQFQRARAIPVPDGFVRVVHELTGFEDEGAIGTIHLLLRERWTDDRPC